jgi:chromosome segregation ATPase
MEESRAASTAEQESMAASVRRLFERHQSIAPRAASSPDVAQLVDAQAELFSYADSLARRLDDALRQLQGDEVRQAADSEELNSLRIQSASLEAACAALSRELEQSKNAAAIAEERADVLTRRFEAAAEELADVRRAREILADELARAKSEAARLADSLERQEAERQALEQQVQRLMTQASAPAEPASSGPSATDAKELKELIDQVRGLAKMLQRPAEEPRSVREVYEPDDVLPPDEPPTVEDWREPIQREVPYDEPEPMEVAAWKPVDGEEPIEESLPPVQNDPHLVIAETFLSRAADAQEGLNWADLAKRYWFIILLAGSVVAFLAWLIPVLISNVGPLTF